MEELRNRHINLIERTSLDFTRHLIKTLPWGSRLIGIKGARGVGKTTLLLQFIKTEYGQSPEAIYISLDDLYFADNRLIDFVNEFIAKGGKHLFVDEVHKYKNWVIEIKNIYDYHPDLKIVFTGSSLLEILDSRADLSRRALVFDLQGLSFREFLQLRHKIAYEKLSVDEIIANHNNLALTIGKTIKPLAYFDEYIKTGYFPFYDGNEILYYKQLQEVLNMILEIELPMLRNTDISIISKIKQLIYIIGQSVPFKPNVSAIANKIQVNRRTILDYFKYLEEANILSILFKDSHGISALQKPDKIYLENTNYMYSIKKSEPEIGNLRETFFLNHLKESHTITYPEKGDFMVDNKYLFEIGGKNKSDKQIAGINNAYIAADNIEYGFENKIPLWMFGFLY